MFQHCGRQQETTQQQKLSPSSPPGLAHLLPASDLPKPLRVLGDMTADPRSNPFGEQAAAQQQEFLQQAPGHFVPALGNPPPQSNLIVENSLPQPSGPSGDRSSACSNDEDGGQGVACSNE